MSEESVIIFPGMRKALRLARVHGFLVEREDGLHHPGGNQPACSMGLARKMVEGGWLVKHGWRYELTEPGLKAAECSNASSPPRPTAKALD
jgi:hypothetical protein